MRRMVTERRQRRQDWIQNRNVERWQIFRGERQEFDCCSRTALEHRIHSRSFKLGEVVTVANSEQTSGLGIVTGNAGENACCGCVRNRFSVEVTYSDGSIYHCRPCQLRHSEFQKLPEVRASAASGGFGISAVGMNGDSIMVHGLTPDSPILELRQCLAKQLGEECWWLVQICVGETIPKYTHTLHEIGLAGEQTHAVNFIMKPKDQHAWQWNMAVLLRALRRGDYEEAQRSIEGVVRANRKFHLTHVVKNVCLAGNEDLLEALVYHVPVEVLCQALLIKRGSIADRYAHCPLRVFHQLWQFHQEAFKSICTYLFETGSLTRLLVQLDRTDSRMNALFMASQEQHQNALNKRLAHLPLLWYVSRAARELYLEFKADVQSSGFSLRDLFAMQLQRAGQSININAPGKSFSLEECWALPPRLMTLMLKWARSKDDLKFGDESFFRRYVGTVDEECAEPPPAALESWMDGCVLPVPRGGRDALRRPRRKAQVFAAGPYCAGTPGHRQAAASIPPGTPIKSCPGCADSSRIPSDEGFDVSSIAGLRSDCVAAPVGSAQTHARQAVDPRRTDTAAAGISCQESRAEGARGQPSESEAVVPAPEGHECQEDKGWVRQAWLEFGAGNGHAASLHQCPTAVPFSLVASVSLAFVVPL